MPQIPKKRLGIGMHSYGMQWKLARQGAQSARFHDPATFLAYAHEIGAGGVQVGIGSRDETYTHRVRKNADAWGMYVEAQATLPFSDTDAERFEREVRSATHAGAAVMRTAMLSGRRYETFRSPAEFRTFAA